ncbi:MAG TPA: hypothetical protein VK789_00275 [Bryobacteraceae bacterium]|nr:hypothetical protein [Bryobacteraceae bacterium]
MSHRFPALVIGLAALAPLQLLSQTAAKKPGAKIWVQPRTPDGQPDIEGVWTNPTITPFERPAGLASKSVLTPEEAADLEKKAVANNTDKPPAPGDVGTYNRVWFDSGTKVVSTHQTSLVVDPPDGRVPLKPSAEAKRDYDLAHNADSYEYMSLWDRCITRGVPAGMFPAGYNNAYQIFQTPGYVTILYEMIHETRVIPIDGSPHVPSGVRLWNGDSRGRWEGNTLVVDITNFNGKGWIGTSASVGRIKGVLESEALHVVERFTRTDQNTILYEVRIDDPNEYTKPWTVSIPLSRDPDYKIYEYACHEGNEAVANVLRGGRAAEAGSK